ncbi:hypothetical protein [Nocardiopsis dassonvillei]|uniref:hypothetical protein n=1 Tax=Nocardiopsis dassonvillei TaxID=2014 RepID=UPI003F571B19
MGARRPPGRGFRRCTRINRRRHPSTREVAEKIVDVVLVGIHATTPWGPVGYTSE